jgi:hypothetical protein
MVRVQFLMCKLTGLKVEEAGPGTSANLPVKLLLSSSGSSGSSGSGSGSGGSGSCEFTNLPT